MSRSWWTRPSALRYVALVSLRGRQDNELATLAGISSPVVSDGAAPTTPQAPAPAQVSREQVEREASALAR